jgi:hypothetical protein
LVQRVAEFHDDIRQVGGQGRMEQKGRGKIVPFLQEMALREGYQWETLQGIKNCRYGVQRFQIVTAGFINLDCLRNARGAREQQTSCRCSATEHLTS